MNKKRVVVTGIAPVSPIGIGKDLFWNSILEQKTNVKEIEYKVDEDLWDKFSMHKIDSFDINHFEIDSLFLDEIYRWKKSEDIVDLFYLMAAAKMALSDSQLNFCRKHNDVGLVLTHENPGINQFAEKMFTVSYDILQSEKLSRLEFFKKVYPLCSRSAYDLQTFMFLFHIGKTLGVHGYTSFINNACASGLYAIETAKMMIESEHCSAVIVAAADKPDIFKYLWFNELGLYASDGIIKPFSSNSDGFVFGEGAAGIVVESLDHALSRNASIYAEYLGGAFAFEGWKVVFPAITENYYANCISRSLQKAQIDPQQVDLIVPHGVGSKIPDRYESRALNKIFLSKKPFPEIAAYKPYVGHNLGGSALLETIILILSMQNNFIPPTLNCDNQDEKTDIVCLTNFKKRNINYAVKTSSAFAGYDGSLVFKRFAS